MKKLLLALALLLAPSAAWAQCTGVFPANTLCGNLTGSPRPPGAFSSAGGTFGPGSTTIGDVTTWGNVGGTLLADTGFLNVNPSTGTFSITPAAGSLGQGLNVSQVGTTGTLGANFNWNYILVQNDLLNITLGTAASIGLHVDVAFGGASPKGSRWGIFGQTLGNSASTSTGGDSIGVVGYGTATQPNGGTNTGAGAAGTLYGGTFAGLAASGAINYNVVSGSEFDANVYTGATAKNRWGVSIPSGGDVNGAVSDGAVVLRGTSTTARWNFGLFLETANSGLSPISVAGTILGTDGGSFTVANFADFHTFTFTGNIFNFPLFAVNGATGLTSISAPNSTAIYADSEVPLLTALAHGSNGTKITSTNPTMGISRVEAINGVDTQSGKNAALFINVNGTNTGGGAVTITQSAGLTVKVFQNGTGDAVGGFFDAEELGAPVGGRTSQAAGIFTFGKAANATSTAYGIQAEVMNNTAGDHTADCVPTTTGCSAVLDLVAAGNHQDSQGIVIRTGGQKFDSGIQFQGGSVTTNVLDVRTTASFVLHLAAGITVTNGIDLSAGTITTKAFLSPGFYVDSAGIVSTQTIANASVATVLGSVGPVGSHTTVQEWIEIKNAAGTIRYVPGF